jgi:hypothetical protein
MVKEAKSKRKHGDLSLHPLTLEKALKGAMETGKPPEPENKHAKRTATKRRAKGRSLDRGDKA